MNAHKPSVWSLGAILAMAILAIVVIVWDQTPVGRRAAPALAAAPLNSTSSLPTSTLDPDWGHHLQQTQDAFWAKVDPQRATAWAQGEQTNTALAPYFSVTATAFFATELARPTSPPPLYVVKPAGAGWIIRGGELFGMDKVVDSSDWIERTPGSFQVAIAAHDWNSGSDVYEVIVEERSLEGNHPFLSRSGFYPLPVLNQDFDIVGAVGETLLLRTIGGSTFAFDVAARKYVSPTLFLPMQRASGEGTLVEDGAVPFSRPGFTGWNRWSIQQGEETLTIYAGADQAKGTDFFSGKPLLAIITSKGAPTASDPVQFYPTTFENGHNLGLMQIIDVSGSQILLQSGDGMIVFDLSTRSYLPKADSYPNFNFDYVEYDRIFDGPFPGQSTATPVP